MSSGGNNREKELAASNAAATAERNKAVAEYKPSPLEERQTKDAMDWYDFVDGKNGPVDYTKAPGLVHAGMYDEGVANRLAERTATGGLEMGKDGANATALGMRKQQLGDQMAERRGADLVSAVRMKDASVRGEITPFLISTAEGRNQSKVGSATSNSASARNAYASYQPPVPFWQTALTAGIGAAGSIFQGRG